MRFELPSFEDSHCKAFGVCAIGAGKDLAAQAGQLKAEGMLALYNSAEGRAIFELTTIQSPERAHFHIDIELKGSRKVSSTHKKEKIFSALRTVSDSKWAIQPRAVFIGPRDRAKDFYIALGTRLEIHPKVEIQMTGVEFSFSTTQIEQLSVSMREKYSSVEMTGKRSVGVLTEDFLTRLFAGLDSFYKAFTRGAER